MGKDRLAVSWLCEGAAVNLCRKEVALTVSVMCEGAAVNFCRKGKACCLLVV